MMYKIIEEKKIKAKLKPCNSICKTFYGVCYEVDELSLKVTSTKRKTQRRKLD